MDKPTPTTQSVKNLSLEDEDVEDLFASPESGATTQKHTPNSQASTSAQKQQQQQHTRSDSRTAQNNAAEAREAKLRAELERVREVNKVIENVTASLTKAKDNMATVNQTVNNASTLLATWTRILSQTEHNQRLILNPDWQGASKDLEEMENEDLRRQQEVERRAAEEQRRREEVVRTAEDDERRRALAAAAAPAGVSSGRGRGRGARGGTSGVSGVRGTRASTRGYTGVGGQTGRGGTAGSSRGTAGGSGLGRTTSTRGRGRGVG